MAFENLKQKIVDALATLRQSSNNLVGLDISSESIRLLKINSAESPHEVENFAISAIPPGLVSKDEIKDQAAVGEILKELFNSAGVSTKNVVIAIPRSSAIIKTITIDSRLNEEEIEARAWVEANRLFPDLVGDIYLDFSIVGPSAQDPGALEMILVACRKDQLKPYMETLRLAGLTAKIVDVNVYALERILNLLCPDADTVGLLNINFDLSSFVVLHDHKLIHAHDQSYDGKRLITQTQNYLQKPENASTDEKTLLANPEYNNILKENLISHLRHTIHFFYSSRPNINIKKMIISGDCSRVAGLSAFIQQEIGIETKIADPFTNMKIGPNINKNELCGSEPALALCCGLALSRLE